MVSVQCRSQMQIMIQIKPVSCCCLLIQQQGPFLQQAEMTPSFVFWSCVNNNQIMTGRKTLCPKFTFGAAIELQRASYLHGAKPQCATGSWEESAVHLQRLSLLLFFGFQSKSQQHLHAARPLNVLPLHILIYENAMKS